MSAVSAALLPALAVAAPWAPTDISSLADGGRTAQRAELIDFDGDGFVDIVFANSHSDGVQGTLADAELNQLLHNDQGAGFTEVDGVFTEADNAWVIKAGDLDNDGRADLVVGDNWSGLSYVLMNDGGGSFTREDIPFSLNLDIGDLELGDVDHDGNLDIFATDWGDTQPHGPIFDKGGPLRLWLGNGDGSFTDGTPNISMGAEVKAAWSFDVDLVDINNDYWLDAVVSTRGDADFAIVLVNDGTGKLVVHDAGAALKEGSDSKEVNTAFTPMDFNGDGYLDLISLQDGGLAECYGNPPVCALKNTVLINDTQGQFTSPADYWPDLDNPGRTDFDAATLDYNNDGLPDFVAVGKQVGESGQNGRLFLNDGTKFMPAPPLGDAFAPKVSQLADTVSVLFADINHDEREDMVLAQRDASRTNYVLLGQDDPGDEVPIDVTPPRIYNDGNFGAKLPSLLKFGDHAELMARVNDYKTPTHWHDFLYDTQLGNLNLVGDGAELTAHGRRLPYLEFAFGLANPDDINTLADVDKYIAPSIWVGEGLWRVGFDVPFSGNIPDTLTWQYCAIDAAGNKACVGPFQIMVEGTCGDGMKQDWEECDSDSPTCIDCKETCGNGVCEEHETPENCPQDCPCGNGVCDAGEEESCPDDCPPVTSGTTGPVCGDMICESPEENGENCKEDCCDGVCDPTGGETCPMDCLCGNGVCDPGEEQSCPDDCPNGTSTGENITGGECPDTAGGSDQCQLDDDGCGCVAEADGTRGLWASLLLFGVFGIRRARRRA